MAHRAWFARRLASLVVVAGALAAVGRSAPAQKKGGTLRLSSILDIDSVDPALAGEPASRS